MGKADRKENRKNRVGAWERRGRGSGASPLLSPPFFLARVVAFSLLARFFRSSALTESQTGPNIFKNFM